MPPLPLSFDRIAVDQLVGRRSLPRMQYVNPTIRPTHHPPGGTVGLRWERQLGASSVCGVRGCRHVAPLMLGAYFGIQYIELFGPAPSSRFPYLQNNSFGRLSFESQPDHSQA